MKKYFTLACSLILTAAVGAQEPQFTDDELIYTQDFNTLPAGSEEEKSIEWVNGETLPGWYANTLASGIPAALNITNVNATWEIDSAAVSGGAGFNNFGLDYGYDRAIGSRISNAIGDTWYAVKLTNNSLKPIGSLNITYTGKQWSCANSLPQSLLVAYKIDANGIDDEDATWTWVEDLTFTSPLIHPVENFNKTKYIDGNLGNHKTEGINATVTVHIPVGSSIWIRWYDFNDVDAKGVDHILSIDDVEIEAVQTSGLETTSGDNMEISLFPVPATDVLNIRTTAGVENVRLVDMLGKETASIPVQGIGEIRVPVGDIPAGVYFVVVKTGDGQKVVRSFIKK